ncbi:hypothetical protein TcCL_Unassigned02702 [Trypanosoma cruzi]|nr:hypothetical protein TcCL_Unassigned02702 [Trypanosoma cruzi]
MDGLLRRLYSTHFASAFIHADGRTLVALYVDIHVRAAAMPTALSLVATWAAEHSLNINADRSGQLCSASPHTDSLRRTLPTIVWAMGTNASNPTRCVCSAMRLIDTSILVCTSPSLQGRPCHAAISCGWVQRLVRPSTPRRRGNRTVSGPHSPPQPGSAAPRQLHSIARPTRKEGCFCPPDRQSSTAAEDHWVPRTHTTPTPHTFPMY